jgi:teichuronic acid biosynthesis protein TuaF
VLKQMGLSIIHRLKRFFILLLIIPLITAGVAFFMEMGKETTYTASVPFELGNFENEKLTGANKIKEYYQSTDYLKLIKEDTGLNYSIEELKNGLNIDSPNDSMIVFKYTSQDKEKAEQIVRGIADYFDEKSEKKYNEKITLLEETMDKLDAAERARGYLAEEEHEVREDTMMKITNIRVTKALEPVTSEASYKNPLKRAVFGFLVGVMLSLFLLIVPELFKEYRD